MPIFKLKGNGSSDWAPGRAIERLRQIARHIKYSLTKFELTAHDRLTNVIDMLPEAIVFMDRDDRIVLWNRRYSELYPEIAGMLRPGVRFREVLKASLATGAQPEDVGDQEAWLAQRVAEHAEPSGTTEQRFRDGRWLRHEHRRTADGGTIGVRVDITDLKRREESFRVLFESNPTPMYVVDRGTLRFTAVNDAALALYGHDRESFLAMTMLDTRPEREREAFLRIVEDGSAFDYPGRQSWTHLRADGSEISVVPYTKPLTIDGRLMCLACIIDLTERKRAEDEVHRAQAFLDSVVESIPVGVFVKDMNDGGRYVIYNRAGETLVGRPRDSIIGRTDHELFPPDEAERFKRQDEQTIGKGELQVFDKDTATRGDGEIRAFLTKKLPITEEGLGPSRYLLGIVEDITERQQMASRLDHLAHHDSLTGLPNRILFHRRLDEAMRDPECRLALHYIDLDGFKVVNDTLGHRIGDGLLCAAALRLSAALSPHDMAARLGGDEFVVLQDRVLAPEDATELGRRLVEVLGAPYDIDGQHVVVGASIGIAFAQGGSDQDSLLRSSDTALYVAKAKRRGSFRLFDPQMDIKARYRRELANEFMRALENKDFVLFYQPFHEVRSGALAGFEALVRWQHPVRGLIQPDEFIPVAEELGMIGALGRWVVRQACVDAVSWPADCLVAVNLSPAQFKERDLLESINVALARSGLAPARLELEITETVLIEDSERNISTLLELRRLGSRIALDDFGTGYSSLSHVQRFAVDRIKIDRSFTRGLPHDRGSIAVLRAIVALAKSLGIKTTVEGVETEAQLACVKAEGCDEVQGYLLGRPAPASMIHGVPRSASSCEAA